MKINYRLFIILILAMLPVATYTSTGRLMAEEENIEPGFDISFDHVAISVANLEESIAWYKVMLGFKVIRRFEDTANKIKVVQMKRSNCQIELFQVAGAKPIPKYRLDPTEDLRVHGVKHFGLQVENAHDAVKELRAKGVEIIMGPIETARGFFVFIRDNSGNALELNEVK
jgi:methylmalonyl-CoA/ethylmalonyl-CoA epimerase